MFSFKEVILIRYFVLTQHLNFSERLRFVAIQVALLDIDNPLKCFPLLWKLLIRDQVLSHFGNSTLRSFLLSRSDMCLGSLPRIHRRLDIDQGRVMILEHIIDCFLSAKRANIWFERHSKIIILMKSGAALPIQSLVDLQSKTGETWETKLSNVLRVQEVAFDPSTY